MATRTLAGKRILVTGGSQGIGYAFALEAAKRGAKVVATARNSEALRVLEASGIATVTGDVVVPADREAMLRFAVERLGGLDILVNNAGVGATGHFGDTGPETLRRILEVNFFALAELTRLCIPELQKGVRPLIVNVSSIFGRRGFPRYSESKVSATRSAPSCRSSASACWWSTPARRKPPFKKTWSNAPPAHRKPRGACPRSP